MARAFADRAEAGKVLAEAVVALGLCNPVVLALPRGGVPVALPVAQALGAPLDLVMVRKIGAPGNRELAVGAVVDGPDPETVFNKDILGRLRLSEDDFESAIAHELTVIEGRRVAYAQGRPAISVKRRDVVLVDDGIATGATVRAALTGLARRDAGSVTLAVPVAPSDMLERIAPLVDHLICLETPALFYAVGQHYAQFGQVGDAEVIACLQAARQQGDGT